MREFSKAIGPQYINTSLKVHIQWPSHDKLTGCFRHLFSCLGLRILTQPKNVVCQPGDKLGFSIETSKTAQAYQWCLNGTKITTDNKDYEGCISEKLSINGCLPKHKGSYQCVVMTELDTSLTAEIATLKIGMYTA